jgi:hypothetical protein
MNLKSNISFDIDGTISDYPDYWLKFLSTRAGVEFSTTSSAKSVLGLDLYQEYKTQWRLGSEKYEIPVRSELLKLADLIYDSGGRVFINSQRPFNLFPQMRERTIDWLSRNRFKFEDVAPKTLTSLSKQQVTCHIDDESIEAFRLMGVPTLSRVILICKDEREFTHKSQEVRDSNFIIPTLLDRVLETLSH